MARVMDRIIALVPDRNKPRIIRASIEQDRRADTRPLRAAIEKALANEPGAAEDPFIAGQRLNGALLDRDLDAVSSIAAALPLKQTLDAGFNQGSRSCSLERRRVGCARWLYEGAHKAGGRAICSP